MKMPCTCVVALVALAILVAPGATTALQQSPPGNAQAILRVRTDTSGVEVFVDGSRIGMTPLHVADLPTGVTNLTLSKAGFKDEWREVNLTSGKPTSLFVVMTRLESAMPPLPAVFSAVHEHAAGSCYGVLTLEVDSLRYKSTDSQDAFSISIGTVRFALRGTGTTLGQIAAIGAGMAGGVAGAAATGVGTVITPNPAASLNRRVVPMRLETTDRNFTIWAYDAAALDSQKRPIAGPAAADLTNQMYDVVYRLFMDDLNRRRPK